MIVFIVCQVGELREYLESIGASFNSESGDLTENLSQIIAACGDCVKACNESG